MYEGQLNQLDTSKDGAVSKAEYQSFMNARVCQARQERQRLAGHGRGQGGADAAAVRLARQKHDGKVSKKEFMNQVMSDFASADHNGDGTLK